MKTFQISILILLTIFLSSSPLLAQGLGIGDIYQDFTIPTLSEDRNGNGTLDDGEDYNGNGVLDLASDVSLYDYEGSIIVMDFFAYWCGPCRTSMPEYQKEIHEYYIDNGGNPAGVPVHIWAVNMYGPDNESEESVDAHTYPFLDDVGISYPVLMDYYRVAYKQIKPTGYSIPHVCIVNGVPNDINHEQWEILYVKSGYSSGITSDYRDIIDQIAPSDKPFLSFSTNQTKYFPKDNISASLKVRYFGDLPAIDLYVALSAFGQFYFYPTWNKNPQANEIITEGGYSNDFILLDQVPVSTVIPEGTYSLMAVCTETGTYNILGYLKQISFDISHKTKGSMRAYFDENPVYFDPVNENWPFKLYLENTGPTNIAIDKFTLEFFDEEGISTGVSDYTRNFTEWFNTFIKLLPVGETYYAVLNITMGTRESGGALFYFHGIDKKNDVEVETTTEYLELLPAK